MKKTRAPLAMAGIVSSLLAACASGGGAGGDSANPLQYATWGPWAAAPGAATPLYTQPSGTKTPAEAMPREGIATYRGRALAHWSGLFGSTEEWEGTADIKADFARFRVDVTINHENDRNGAIYDYSATLTGNSYSGIASEGCVPLLGCSSGGRVDGAFYGPKAEETAGTYTWGGVGYSVRGSFGAK